MKKLLVFGVLIIIGAFVVDALGDATQTRDDERRTDQATQIVFHVEGKHFRNRSTPPRWHCSASAVDGRRARRRPRHRTGRPGDYRFAMTPTLGDHGKERLLGCMNDLTIERLRSNVESVHDALGTAA